LINLGLSGQNQEVILDIQIISIMLTQTELGIRCMPAAVRLVALMPGSFFFMLIMGLAMLVRFSVPGCFIQITVNKILIDNYLFIDLVIQELYASSNANNGSNTRLLYLNANNGASNANANISSQLLLLFCFIWYLYNLTSR